MLRAGCEASVSQSELVVGDIALVETGDILQASAVRNCTKLYFRQALYVKARTLRLFARQQSGRHDLTHLHTHTARGVRRLLKCICEGFANGSSRRTTGKRSSAGVCQASQQAVTSASLAPLLSYIQADGLLLDRAGGGELKLDESQLTGESDDAVKNAVSAPFLYAGSRLREGFGRMLVLAVGALLAAFCLLLLLAAFRPLLHCMLLLNDMLLLIAHEEFRSALLLHYIQQTPFSKGAPWPLVAPCAGPNSQQGIIRSLVLGRGGADGVAAKAAAPVKSAAPTGLTPPPAATTAGSEPTTPTAASSAAPRAAAARQASEEDALDEETPLTAKLEVLAGSIGSVGLAASLGVFAVNAGLYTWPLLQVGSAAQCIFLSFKPRTLSCLFEWYCGDASRTVLCSAASGEHTCFQILHN